jgi:hypothetical protein
MENKSLRRLNSAYQRINFCKLATYFAIHKASKQAAIAETKISHLQNRRKSR